MLWYVLFCNGHHADKIDCDYCTLTLEFPYYRLERGQVVLSDWSNNDNLEKGLHSHKVSYILRPKIPHCWSYFPAFS